MASKLNHILVTGGCGFIGSNFIHYWLGERIFSGKLINLDALTYAGNPMNLKEFEGDERYVFIKGDISDGELATSLLKEYRIDAVINFAAESHVDRSIDSPQPFAKTNVVGTLELLNCCRLYWQNELNRLDTFRFLHVSTDEVYGTLLPDAPSFSEENPFAPNSPYAASKAASDHFVRAYFHTYGMPVLTTNCSNNYGPFQFPEKLIPLMIQNALAGKPLPIYGDGQQRRDWLYVKDHCSAIQRVLESGEVGETYNVGGDCEKANLEIVETTCSLLDELKPKEGGGSYLDLKTFVEDRPGHDRRYSINFSKIRDQLQWEPRESLETGLRKTVSWYLKHEDWVDDIRQNRYQQQRLGVG
ncbi:MAG: dTDP-glucose 4,6-dehydratase [Verrucomicrobiota bacterium]